MLQSDSQIINIPEAEFRRNSKSLILNQQQQQQH